MASRKQKKIKSYAGVPHLKGDVPFNRSLSKLVASTQNGASFSFGGFSALYDMKGLNLRHPVLVSSTDGVGTKLELARLRNSHDTIGVDLVAMCVNDLITCGARPISFLDYFATGHFDKGRTLDVIRGIVKGCKQSGCPLLGGETAIMPGFYADSRYDLAGFSVGAVEKSKLIDGSKVKTGHVLLGLASSGFHSNGYSLLRKLFTKRELSGKIGQFLMRPTQIYVKPVLDLALKMNVLAISHITGGGIIDNLPRVLPKGLGATIDKASWRTHQLFRLVQKKARYQVQQIFL